MTTEAAHTEAQDSYKNYADYNGVLRTWFVSFGLGALVLFMLHPDLVELLRGRGHFLTVVILFLLGCFGQIAVALINKFSSWHVFDATQKGVQPGRVTKFFYDAFWVDKLIDGLTVACFVIAIWTMVNDFVLTKPQQSSLRPDEFALQTTCAEAAAKLFQRSGLDPKSGNSYKNHWNRKQKKCFIQINSTTKESYLSIEVYDVFESKRYASFFGHLVCDPALGTRACQFDSATIWLDGDDDRLHGDQHFGFAGLPSGKFGSGNTKTEYLAHIRTFMFD